MRRRRRHSSRLGVDAQQLAQHALEVTLDVCKHGRGWARNAAAVIVQQHDDLRDVGVVVALHRVTPRPHASHTSAHSPPSPPHVAQRNDSINTRTLWNGGGRWWDEDSSMRHDSGSSSLVAATTTSATGWSNISCSMQRSVRCTSCLNVLYHGVRSRPRFALRYCSASSADDTWKSAKPNSLPSGDTPATTFARCCTHAPSHASLHGVVRHRRQGTRDSHRHPHTCSAASKPTFSNSDDGTKRTRSSVTAACEGVRSGVRSPDTAANGLRRKAEQPRHVSHAARQAALQSQTTTRQ